MEGNAGFAEWPEPGWGVRGLLFWKTPCLLAALLLGKSLCRWASMAGTSAEGHGHLFGCPSIAPPRRPGRPLSEEPECVGLGPDAQRERVCWWLPGSPVQPHDLLLTRRHPA